jgi:hypothetical protein
VPYGDALAKWVKTRKQKGLCVHATNPVQLEFRKVADYVDTTYSRPKSEEFLSGADPWVVAHTLHLPGTVVTQESIPIVCQHFGIECVDTFQMLEWLKAKF